MKIVRKYTVNGKTTIIDVSEYPDLKLTPEQVKDAANYPIVYADKRKTDQ